MFHTEETSPSVDEFGQQWSHKAQRNKVYQALIHRLDLLVEDIH